jgi:hypothetical protein
MMEDNNEEENDDNCVYPEYSDTAMEDNEEE